METSYILVFYVKLILAHFWLVYLKTLRKFNFGVIMKKIIVLALAILASTQANAGFIVNSSISLGTISISGSAVDFYDYTLGSSNTGFEQNNTAVFFLAENGTSTYLYALLDSPAGTDVGGVTFSLTDNSPLIGNFAFVDEASEFANASVVGTTTSIKFKWVAGYADGLVYELGGINGTSISITLGELTGLDSAVFLSFDSLGNPTEVLSETITGSSLNLNLGFQASELNEVSSPNALLILLSGILLLSLANYARRMSS